jgi:hypothetical protein
MERVQDLQEEDNQAEQRMQYAKPVKKLGLLSKFNLTKGF